MFRVRKDSEKCVCVPLPKYVNTSNVDAGGNVTINLCVIIINVDGDDCSSFRGGRFVR